MSHLPQSRPHYHRMSLIRLERTLFTFLHLITRSLPRLARAMWDQSVRFAFGPRQQVADEEAAQSLLPPADHEATTEPSTSAAMDIPNTRELMEQLQQDLQSLPRDNTKDADSTPPPLADDDDDLDLVDPYATDDPNRSGYDILHDSLSNILTQGNTGGMPCRKPGPLEQLQEGLQSISIPKTRPATKRFSLGGESETDGVDENVPPVELPQTQPYFDDHAPLTLSHEEEIEMEAILTPVRGQLQRLKQATPESMPAYHPNVRTKSHTQVLKVRLAEIGEHIAAHLEARGAKGVVERALGVRELKLCLFIARKYWPLSATESTHMGVLHMYRNARFRATPPAQLDAEQASHRQWADEVLRLSRPSFGEAASQLVGSLSIRRAADTQAPNEPKPSQDLSDEDREAIQAVLTQDEIDNENDEPPDLVSMSARPNTPNGSGFGDEPPVLPPTRSHSPLKLNYRQNGFDDDNMDEDELPDLVPDSAKEDIAAEWDQVELDSVKKASLNGAQPEQESWQSQDEEAVAKAQQIAADEALARTLGYEPDDPYLHSQALDSLALARRLQDELDRDTEMGDALPLAAIMEDAAAEHRHYNTRKAARDKREKAAAGGVLRDGARFAPDGGDEGDGGQG
jgi:hypothetical protein